MSSGEKQLELLTNRIQDLDYMQEQQDEQDLIRFNEEETREFVKSLKNPNTLRKTNSDLAIVKDYLKELGEERLLQDIEPRNLDMLLARFMMNAKQKKGKDAGKNYQPDSISSIFTSLRRFLKENGYICDLKTAIEFSHTRDVLSSKRKLLKQEGEGNRNNRAQPFSADQIEAMYNAKVLGNENPVALLRTMWLNNTTFFGLRGCTEHHSMKWGDLKLQCDTNGNELILFNERSTKTRYGQDNALRSSAPKMFGLPGNPRCPVSAFKLYSTKRPDSMRSDDSPFYLQDIKRPIDNKVWYKNMQVGVNKLNTFGRALAESIDLPGKHSNHSVRRTAIQQLCENEVQDNDIIHITGHRNSEGLKPYKQPSHQMVNKMSNILADRVCPAPKETSIPTTSKISSVETVEEDFWNIHCSELDDVISSINTYENVIDVSIPVTTAPITTLPVTIPQTAQVQQCNPMPFGKGPFSFLNGHVSGNVTININYNMSAPSSKRRRVEQTVEITSSQSSESSQSSVV